MVTSCGEPRAYLVSCSDVSFSLPTSSLVNSALCIETCIRLENVYRSLLFRGVLPVNYSILFVYFRDPLFSLDLILKDKNGSRFLSFSSSTCEGFFRAGF